MPAFLYKRSAIGVLDKIKLDAGITDADNIIAALNENRVDGSTIPAYLAETATRPDFKMISMSRINMPVISIPKIIIL